MDRISAHTLEFGFGSLFEEVIAVEIFLTWREDYLRDGFTGDNIIKTGC